MELPGINSKTILPKPLLARFESDLASRMGSENWIKRKAVESRIDSGGKITFLRIVHFLHHHASKSLIRIILSAFGLRTEAHENCWQTQLHFHQQKLSCLQPGQSLRILHLSDFHLDTRLDQSDRWAQMIQSLEYDLTVITGDFLNGFRLPDPACMKAIGKVISVIKGPIYGILGNHDCALSTPYLESIGIKILLNESQAFNCNGIQIQISGLDDPHFFKSDDLSRCSSTFKNSPPPNLKILLVHAPREPRAYADLGFDLCLCGHTHGGQICTSKSVPLLRNGLYATETIGGWWTSGNMKGFTSRGTGTGRLSYRLNCPPEIVVHHLQPKH